jgi:hypothetical protein
MDAWNPFRRRGAQDYRSPSLELSQKTFLFVLTAVPSFSEARQQDGWPLAHVVEVVARREPQNSPRNTGMANLFHLHVPSPESVREAQEAPIRVDPKE